MTAYRPNSNIPEEIRDYLERNAHRQTNYHATERYNLKDIRPFPGQSNRTTNTDINSNRRQFKPRLRS